MWYFINFCGKFTFENFKYVLILLYLKNNILYVSEKNICTLAQKSVLLNNSAVFCHVFFALIIRRYLLCFRALRETLKHLHFYKIFTNTCSFRKTSPDFYHIDQLFCHTHVIDNMFLRISPFNFVPNMS